LIASNSWEPFQGEREEDWVGEDKKISFRRDRRFLAVEPSKKKIKRSSVRKGVGEIQHVKKGQLSSE